MNQDDIRALLDRVADESTGVPVDPEPLLRRGYRRMARTVVAGAVGIACAIAVVVGGVGLIRSSAPTTIPADEGQPTEPPETVTGETTETWTGPCADSQDGPPPRACFGPLQEGMYTSQRFEPALTFTVPAGWNNPWDTRGSFDLWTPGWSDGADDPDDPGIYLFYHAGLHVSRDLRAVNGCSDVLDETVGVSAAELAELIAAHPGVETTGPSPVTVGGLAGYRLDLSIADDWEETCPQHAGLVVVPLLDDLSLIEKQPYSSVRLYLLDLPAGGSVAIKIDGAVLDEAMPVVDSFEFHV